MISFELNEIQKQIQDTARKFAQEEIAPSVIERDINGTYPAEIIQKMADLGFMGMMVSPEWGGSGLDTLSYVVAQEEICKVDASVGIIFSVHNSLINWIIETYGTQAQKEKYLRNLAEGKIIGAYCLSEAEAGSDASHQKTKAVFKDGYWILNGMKSWISTAQNAGLYIIFAQTNEELRHKGITCFVVERGTEGFEPAKKEDKMGMRSSDTCAIAMTNVKIPDENRIGEVGQGFYIAMSGLNGGRIGIAAQALGIAQGAYEASVRYSKQRKSFGKFLIEHQLIQAKLAQMAMNIEAARLLVYKAAWLKDQGNTNIMAASQAKLFASTVANDVTREAVQIHGGYGYVRAYHVERMMRDAKVTEIYEGTSEIQHLVIAREIAKNVNF
jgi:alkylation response protein AidB-like acyl-CoA dehydrogenase